MGFASGLRQSLQVRDDQVPTELHRGDSLEEVLDRHLLAVEEMAETELLTSVLLLSEDGKRLYHGAAPNLPHSYRRAIDGAEIGPSAGSCGTAAHFDCPIYVDDIAMDPLWADYRDLALEHGLRSCWSTPIRDHDGAVIGTFAIYHRAVGSPSKDELEAIEMITGHVGHAIMWARDCAQIRPWHRRPLLRLVHDSEQDNPAGPFAELLAKVLRLEAITAELERQGRDAQSDEACAQLEILVEDSRKLAAAIRKNIEIPAKSPH